MTKVEDGILHGRNTMGSYYPEPTLDEMLSDTVIKAMMDADAIDSDELKAMLRRVGTDALASRGLDYC
jgi:hypothetical protein